MRLSGLIRFDELNAVGAQIIREFERRYVQGIQVTFGPSPDTAVVRWDASVQMSVVTRMAALVANRQGDGPARPNFSTSSDSE